MDLRRLVRVLTHRVEAFAVTVEEQVLPARLWPPRARLFKYRYRLVENEHFIRHVNVAAHDWEHAIHPNPAFEAMVGPLLGMSLGHAVQRSFRRLRIRDASVVFYWNPLWRKLSWKLEASSAQVSADLRSAPS